MLSLIYLVLLMSSNRSLANSLFNSRPENAPRYLSSCIQAHNDSGRPFLSSNGRYLTPVHLVHYRMICNDPSSHRDIQRALGASPGAYLNCVNQQIESSTFVYYNAQNQEETLSFELATVHYCSTVINWVHGK